MEEKSIISAEDIVAGTITANEIKSGKLRFSDLTRSEMDILNYMKDNSVMAIPQVSKGAKDLHCSKAYYHVITKSLFNKGYLQRSGQRYIIL